MSKHKQGPSFQLPDFATDPDDSDDGASLLDHGFKWGWNSCLEAIAKDNARLIAAAAKTAAERDRLKEINAELLDALIKLFADGAGCSYANWTHAQHAAHDAIDKATGEQ